MSALLATAALQAADGSGEPVDFTLPQLHGDQVRLADLRQQWVVLNYWATWCAPCRKEIPDLTELHSSREDIVVLG
ncbi:MAG: TlpA disulfide reductase family protein, partial [Lysobacterales bacterium]